MNSLLASQFFCDVFDILSESSSHILSVALKTYSPRTKAIDLCYPPQQGDIGSEIKKVQQAPFCTLRSFTIMDNDEDWFSDNARNLSTLFSKVLRLFCKNRTRLNLHLHTSNCLVCVDTVLPRLYTYFFSLSITYAGQPSQEFLNKAVVHGHLQELYLVNEYCTEKWPTTTTKTLETLVKQLQWTKIVLDYNTEFSTFECFSDLFEQWHLGPQNMAMTASGRREFTFYAKFPVKEFAKHVDIAPDNAWENSIVYLRKEHPDGPFYVTLKVKKEFNCHTYCHLVFAKNDNSMKKADNLTYKFS